MLGKNLNFCCVAWNRQKKLFSSLCLLAFFILAEKGLEENGDQQENNYSFGMTHIWYRSPVRFWQKKVMKKVKSRCILKIQEANQIIINERTAVNYKKDSAHVTPLFYNSIQKSVIKKHRNVHHPPISQLWQIYSATTPTETTNHRAQPKSLV